MALNCRTCIFTLYTPYHELITMNIPTLHFPQKLIMANRLYANEGHYVRTDNDSHEANITLLPL